MSTSYRFMLNEAVLGACCLLAQTALAAGSPATNLQAHVPALATADVASGSRSFAGENVWLLDYFRQRYEGRVEIDAEGRARQVPLPNPMKEERLHFALSTDGRHWEPLNSNRPVWEHWLRDPFLQRGSDGRWHLLATGGERRRGTNDNDLGPTCLYATSRDLLKWENVRSPRLMQGVRDETGRPGTQHLGAGAVRGSNHRGSGAALVFLI